MNRLEEIQEIIKNFIYEKQQMTQQITEIEAKRNKIAQERNCKKSLNENTNNAYAKDAEAEISELGEQIAELGNQSQELQNKLNSRYLEIKKQVNITIDNLISEGIREIRKIEEQKKDIEESMLLQEARNAKYEVQKQEFFTRFGRMPELSENAEKENKIQEEEYNEKQKQISEFDVRIEKKEEELSELARYKRAVKNENWNLIIREETQEPVAENEIEEIKEETAENLVEEQAEKISENVSDQEVQAVIEEIEESIQIENAQNIVEEQENIQKTEEVTEEAITLPLTETNSEFAENVEIEPEVSTIQEIEEVDPLEEVEIEYLEPLEEINIEDIQPIEEIKVEEIEPIQEIKVEEIEALDEITLEDIQPIEETSNVSKVEELDNKEQTIKLETFENVQKVEGQAEAQPIQENAEKEIITCEEAIDKTQEIPTLGEKVTIANIIAKFDNGELVYKAQLSNGNEIDVYPRKAETGNIILKDKENREELKEILINYAVAEYRALDKKVIKKIDPIICEVLAKFAKQYNYDAQNLIYNYAMSFSKNDESEIEAIPSITYNISYMDGTLLNKKEKEILSKICKNAKKNEKIDIIGWNAGLSKIRYILKRTFNSNNANALPEGKY